jgi:hypothetical protein
MFPALPGASDHFTGTLALNCRAVPTGTTTLFAGEITTRLYAPHTETAAKSNSFISLDLREQRPLTRIQPQNISALASWFYGQLSD